MKIMMNNYAENSKNNLYIICIYAENCVYLHRNSMRRLGGTGRKFLKVLTGICLD